MVDFASDADLTHPWATRYRIPLVGTIFPTWFYEVALCVPDDNETVPSTEWGGSNLYKATWPTEDEARVIGSAIDFRRSYYRGHWQAKMLERPLDVDSSTNSVILLRQEHRWTWRMGTWDMAMSQDDSFEPTKGGLIRLLGARIFNYNRAWPTWVEDHPDVFGEPAAPILAE